MVKTLRFQTLNEKIIKNSSIMKSNRTHTPPPELEDLGNGTTYYNFDVIQSQREDDDEGVITQNYDYDQVTVENPVTKQKIKDAIVTEGYDLEKLEQGVDELDIG